MYALGCPLFQCAGLRLRIDIEIVLRGFQLTGLNCCELISKIRTI
jgi:hypothetical protein